MRSCLAAILLCLNVLAVSAASAAELPDLTVSKVQIIPNSVADARQDPTFKPEAIIEVATAEAGDGLKKLSNAPRPMRMYRSYRFLVTVRNLGQAPVTGTFMVRTECIRDGKEPILLGQTVWP